MANDTRIIRAALAGIGLVRMPEAFLTPFLESGALIQVLEGWYEPFAGFYLSSEPASDAAGAACADRVPTRRICPPRPDKRSSTEAPGGR